MPTGTSLVVLDAESRSVRQKRPAVLSLLAAAAGLIGLAGLGAVMLLSAPQPPMAVSGQDGPNSAPQIAVAPVVFAQPWQETPFPIHVVPPGTQPRSFIQIDGLPGLAMLSEGHATRPGSWKVPVSRLATLRITSPATEDAKPRLAIALLSHDGVVLSEVRPLLAVVAPERIGPLPAVRPSPPLPEMQPTRCSARTAPAQAAPESDEAAAWIWPGVRAEARALLRKADEAIEKGRVGAARQTYEYVADGMRWPTAALALAATYDPHELGYLAPLVVADPEKARHWYTRARALTEARIDFHVARLGPPAADRSVEPLPPLSAEPAPLWVWLVAMEAKTIVRWGDEALSRGYIEAARQIYEYGAVVMRWPTAAQSLAATYDPEELKQLDFHGFTPEPEKARLWYERSRELMNARIDFHLQRLGATPAPRPARPWTVASCL